MNVKEKTPKHPGVSLQLKMGICLFGISIVAPLCGIPLVAAMGMSAAQTATISGILLMGAEILGVLAVGVMGKDGYAFLKKRVAGLIKPFAPLKTVSPHIS